MPGRIGVFGKIAGLGDFLRRDLPPGFAEIWDPWLASVMSESRAQLGASWEEAYASAPIWRFALAPGVAGPAACLGILMPSQDRVGRLFPLTLVTAAAADRAAAALGDDTVLLAWEDAALDTLDASHGPAAFEAARAALRPPEGAAGASLTGTLWRCAEAGPPRAHAGLPDGAAFSSMLAPAGHALAAGRPA
ncbi:MAG: type VI secretion system-associated protein TagF [Pseudomonadota bacterium]